MKTLFALATLVALFGLFPVHAQIYSARRLTQRIAPLLPPAPTNPVRPVVTQTAVQKVPAPLLQAQSPPQPSPQLAEEVAPAVEPKPEIDRVPLLIECGKVEADPREFLQYVHLSLSNDVAKAVSQVTMRLIYSDRSGEKLKEWTTRRDFDHVLMPNGSLELDQPAFFMPLITKHVKIEVLHARFADGTEWTEAGH